MPTFVYLTVAYATVCNLKQTNANLNNKLNSVNTQNVVTPRKSRGIRDITGNDASISVYSMTRVHTPGTECK